MNGEPRSPIPHRQPHQHRPDAATRSRVTPARAQVYAGQPEHEARGRRLGACAPGNCRDGRARTGRPKDGRHAGRPEAEHGRPAAAAHTRRRRRSCSRCRSPGCAARPPPGSSRAPSSADICVSPRLIWSRSPRPAPDRPIPQPPAFTAGAVGLDNPCLPNPPLTRPSTRASTARVLPLRRSAPAGRAGTGSLRRTKRPYPPAIRHGQERGSIDVVRGKIRPQLVAGPLLARRRHPRLPPRIPHQESRRSESPGDRHRTPPRRVHRPRRRHDRAGRVDRDLVRGPRPRPHHPGPVPQPGPHPHPAAVGDHRAGRHHRHRGQRRGRTSSAPAATPPPPSPPSSRSSR